jgi:nucleoside-diphosphate-sugar epimerase
MGPIAIIGAAGFVGTRLVEALVLDGDTSVRAIVRAYRNFASLSRFGSLITVNVADAERSAALVPAVRGCSVVVNLTTGTPTSIMRTTRAIYEACVTAKVRRLIHLSSAVVYGEVNSAQIADDSPPITGHWMPYARAKAAAEIWLRNQLPGSPLEVAVLRPGIVWGVRSPHMMAIIKALLDKTAYLVNDGNGIFNSIYVDNLIACLRACRAHRGDAGGFYNVADREVIRWRDFFTAFGSSLGCDIRKIPSVSGDRFPWSAPALLDHVQSLPLVNGLYHRLKSKLPEAVKPRIKSLLAGRYNYEETPRAQVARPRIERELWSLQRVRNKLPTTKFARKFGFMPPVTFAEGVRRTLGWLAFIGYTPLQVGAVNNGAAR